MNICANSHEEIVHEGRQCPLCEATKELNELTTDLQRVEAELEEMKVFISEFEKTPGVKQ